MKLKLNISSRTVSCSGCVRLFVRSGRNAPALIVGKNMSGFILLVSQIAPKQSTSTNSVGATLLLFKTREIGLPTHHV